MRILAPGGPSIFRHFVSPVAKETPAAVMADLRAGRVSNLSVLKLRLTSAIQHAVEEGAAVHDVWKLCAKRRLIGKHWPRKLVGGWKNCA